MIYLASLYAADGRLLGRRAATSAPSAASFAWARVPSEARLDIRTITAWELGFMAGLIAADHPQLWDEERLCARFNESLDTGTETR